MKLAPGRYGYEALEVGDSLETVDREITAAMIDDFARLSGDDYDIHMDAGAARAKGFADRVAHGLLVLSVIDGLKNNAEAQFDALASMGWDWRFAAPVLAGDRVRVCFTVRSKRVTRNGNRGLLESHAEVFNQRDEIVQSGCNTLIFDL